MGCRCVVPASCRVVRAFVASSRLRRVIRAFVVSSGRLLCRALVVGRWSCRPGVRPALVVSSVRPRLGRVVRPSPPWLCRPSVPASVVSSVPTLVVSCRPPCARRVVPAFVMSSPRLSGRVVPGGGRLVPLALVNLSDVAPAPCGLWLSVGLGGLVQGTYLATVSSSSSTTVGGRP